MPFFRRETQRSRLFRSLRAFLPAADSSRAAFAILDPVETGMEVVNDLAGIEGAVLLPNEIHNHLVGKHTPRIGNK